MNTIHTPIDTLTLIDTVRCFYPETEGERLQQPGFGELPVPNGEQTIEPTNKLIAGAVAAGLLIRHTVEGHPAETAHFSPTPNFVNTWPPHGRKGTPGAMLHPDLLIAQNPTLSMAFVKGEEAIATPDEDDSYTGALARNKATGLLLPEQLRKDGARHILLAGLALGDGKENPLCVDSTAKDLRADGFEVTLAIDATEAVLPENRQKCIDNLGALGVHIATTDEVLAVIATQGGAK